MFTVYNMANADDYDIFISDLRVSDYHIELNE